MNAAANTRRAHGQYRKLLAVVRSGIAYPAMAVDYACAWAADNAFARVITLPDDEHNGNVAEESTNARPDGRTGPDVAAGDAMRRLLLARGLHATMSFLPPGSEEAGLTSAIAQEATRFGADVVLTDYPGLAQLAHPLPCDVLYLPVDGSHRFRVPPRRIFVASDESAIALGAYEEAQRLAGTDTQLRQAYVSFDPARQESPGSGAIVLIAAHHDDNLAHAILQAAREWNADLLVLGTHGTEHQARWRFGRVAGAVALLSDMPLLVVPEKR